MSTDFESKAREILADCGWNARQESGVVKDTASEYVRTIAAALRAQDRESLERAAQVCDEREEVYQGEAEACESNGEDGSHFDSLADECAGLATAIRALASEPGAGTEGRPSYCSKHQTPQADCPLCNPTGWSVAPSTAGSAARREAMIERALVKARDLLHWHLGTTITDDSAIEEAEACIEQADAALDAK